MTRSKPYSWFCHSPQSVQPKVSFFILNRNFILPVSKFQSSFTTLSLLYLFHQSFNKSFKVFLQNRPWTYCFQQSSSLTFWYKIPSSFLALLHFTFYSWLVWFIPHLRSFLHKAAKVYLFKCKLELVISWLKTLP